MSVRDAEHQLNLEISENETRKDFSKSERIDYARRLERIERAKARERQATSTGGADPQLRQNSDEADRTIRSVVCLDDDEKGVILIDTLRPCLKNQYRSAKSTK